MRKTMSTNIYMRRLIHALKKQGAPLWREVAEYLSRPRRKRIQVNLSRINRYSGDGDIVVVPGKVLGSGVLSKKVTVVAWRFSEEAYKKIQSVGRAVLLEEFLQTKPESKNIKIIT
ncbi:MAG: 50S ribosomal protein L18e [Infirmifilum sp.]